LEQAREDMTGGAQAGQQNLSNQQMADNARARGAPKCLADDIANGTVNTDDLAMDHTLEVKLGGDAWPGPGGTPLMPLDRSVNGAFGNLMKNTSNQMGAGTEVEEISLVCPPNGSCPQRGYSTGSVQRAFPDTGWVTTSV
jgi:hypothetical protein